VQIFTAKMGGCFVPAKLILSLQYCFNNTDCAKLCSCSSKTVAATDNDADVYITAFKLQHVQFEAMNIFAAASLHWWRRPTMTLMFTSRSGRPRVISMVMARVMSDRMERDASQRITDVTTRRTTTVGCEIRRRCGK